MEEALHCSQILNYKKVNFSGAGAGTHAGTKERLCKKSIYDLPVKGNLVVGNDVLVWVRCTGHEWSDNW